MNKNIDYTALGKRIKEKRIERGLTQEQLGELCELSAAHIGHIERGTRILSVDVLFRISQALDTSIDWLVFDSIENRHMLNETNGVLKIAGLSPLYPKIKRDSIIIINMHNNKSVAEINEALYNENENTLN